MEDDDTPSGGPDAIFPRYLGALGTLRSARTSRRSARLPRLALPRFVLAPEPPPEQLDETPPPSLRDEPTNAVEPKIELEYKVVLADPDLAKHQDAKKSDGTTDEMKIVTDATYIQVSATESSSAPKYTKGGKVEVTVGSDKVKIYTDKQLTKPLDRPLTNAELFGSSPFVLYVAGLKGKEGQVKLKLTLEPSGDERIEVKEMEPVEMAVVMLDFKLHQHKEDKIVNEEFEADQDTLDAYFDALKDKVIPDQEEMSDEHQVKPGRMLHKQKDGNHGRAKLLLKKLAGAWPAGTDDYYVVVDQAHDSGEIAVYDKETDGSKKDLPYKVKVSDLKANDVELWVEGSGATKLWRDVVVEAGIDREAGGLAKDPKHNGDWARFTVVQVKEIKLDYTATAGQPDAWDDTNKRFYVNYKAGADGRKIKLVAELTEKLSDIPLHFMLAPHQANGKQANWGVDLPATWIWKDIDEGEVKHKDRSAQKKLLHLSKKTDANGKADLELTLSRIGGDVFEPGAYITQDPHLAKYVKDHSDLGTRKPVIASHTITVWRRFAYQRVTVTGRAYPSTSPSESAYDLVKAKMLERPAKNYTQAEVGAMALPALYQEYNFKVGGGNDIVLNVSDSNTGQFFADIAVEPEHPIKVPVVTCDYNWGEPQDSAPAVGLDDLTPASFPLNVDMNVLVSAPPLQGNALLVSGDWTASDWDAAANGGAGDYVNHRNGSFADGEITVAADRTNLKQIRIVALPAGIGAVTPDTSIDITNLVVQGAGNFFLGGYNIDGNKRIVCVYDPNDAQDYQNTVIHELGHAFHQTLDGPPANGIPSNPNYILNTTGPHCTYDTDKCVMFTSGPIAGSLNQYCPDCHPHLLVQDMQRLA